jgi:hypothetical protein
MTAVASAIRPLRTAVIGALKEGVPSVSNRVYTPPVKQSETRFPRLVVDGYEEDPSNFFNRSGSRVQMLVKGQVRSEAGDGNREALWGEVFDALHEQPLVVDGHLHLLGTLRRTATYLDPDGVTLHFVGTYEGVTRLVNGES